MNKEDNYIAINRDAWNKKTDAHIQSDFYDVPGFLAGNTSLNSFELDLLGDVAGKSILHLQCHFGQDSISLSRMGAKVTGVDFSEKAIQRAKEFAHQLDVDTTFICSDVYELPQHLNQHFDIVFTSYGTIGWLPDLDRWAGVISHFLKPGGKFVFVEFHPVVWMFDDHFKEVHYNYFKKEAIIETFSGTYADRNADFVQENVSWNHSLSEVLTSLLQQKMELTSFSEWDYSPYNCFQEMIEIAPKKFRIKHLEDKIPMVYSLSASKKL